MYFFIYDNLFMDYNKIIINKKIIHLLLCISCGIDNPKPIFNYITKMIPNTEHFVHFPTKLLTIEQCDMTCTFSEQFVNVHVLNKPRVVHWDSNPTSKCTSC